MKPWKIPKCDEPPKHDTKMKEAMHKGHAFISGPTTTTY